MGLIRHILSHKDRSCLSLHPVQYGNFNTGGLQITIKSFYINIQTSLPYGISAIPMSNVPTSQRQMHITDFTVSKGFPVPEIEKKQFYS